MTAGNPNTVGSVAGAAVLDGTTSIAAYLDAAAAKRAAPGGGSVAALTGALAAAMGEMVLNYSVGRKDSGTHDPALREALAELTRARAVLSALMVEDQLAFSALSAARKSAGDHGDRDPAYGAALLACIRIPQSIGVTAAIVLEIAERVLPLANRYLLSDLAVCAELAMATIRSAGYNVRVNLAEVSDAGERDRFSRAGQVLLARSVERVQRLVPAIWGRIDEGRSA